MFMFVGHEFIVGQFWINWSAVSAIEIVLSLCTNKRSKCIVLQTKSQPGIKIDRFGFSSFDLQKKYFIFSLNFVSNSLVKLASYWYEINFNRCLYDDSEMTIPRIFHSFQVNFDLRKTSMFPKITWVQTNKHFAKFVTSRKQMSRYSCACYV